MTDEEINEKARAILCAALRNLLREVESSPAVLDEMAGMLRRWLFPATALISTLVGLDIRTLIGAESGGVRKMAEMQEGEKKGRN
jgi:hypothetical protein